MAVELGKSMAVNGIVSIPVESLDHIGVAVVLRPILGGIIVAREHQHVGVSNKPKYLNDCFLFYELQHFIQSLCFAGQSNGKFFFSLSFSSLFFLFELKCQRDFGA